MLRLAGLFLIPLTMFPALASPLRSIKWSRSLRLRLSLTNPSQSRLRAE